MSTHTMLDNRERASKGTADAKHIQVSLVPWHCLNEMDSSEDVLLVCQHLEHQLQLTAPLAWPTACIHFKNHMQDTIH